MAKNDEFDDLTVHRRRDGENPTETISGTGASLSFSGNAARDIHDSTDVALTNGTTASVTEDVIVNYYEGIDATGTLITSETQSVTLAAGASGTTTFLTDDFGLGIGDYFIEVVTTALTVDSIDEHTLGASYVTEQTDEGDLVTTDHSGRERARYDAMSDAVAFPSITTHRLRDGEGTAETISGAGATLSFVGSETRDIHDSTDVSLTNGTTGSVTEDVIVNYYEGVDATGALITSETQSITLAAGASSTSTFLPDNFALGIGDYFIEVVTTALTVDSIDEHTLGASYVTEQTDEGDLVTTDQGGRERVRYDSLNDGVSFPSISAGSATVTDAPIADTDVIRNLELTNHSGSVAGVHGIATGDSVAAQSAVDAKAADPHDNLAHSTNYSAEGHDHTGETLLPESIHYQARTTNPAAPASGVLTFLFNDGVTEELRAINAAGTVVTLATF